METTSEDKIELLLRVAKDVDVDSRKRPAVDTIIHDSKKKGLSQYTPSAADMKTELEQALKARDDARNELTKLLAGTYEAYAGHAKRVHTMQQQRTEDVKKIETLEKKVAELQHHKQQLERVMYQQQAQTRQKFGELDFYRKWVAELRSLYGTESEQPVLNGALHAEASLSVLQAEMKKANAEVSLLRIQSQSDSFKLRNIRFKIDAWRKINPNMHPLLLEISMMCGSPPSTAAIAVSAPSTSSPPPTAAIEPPTSSTAAAAAAAAAAVK